MTAPDPLETLIADVLAEHHQGGIAPCSCGVHGLHTWALYDAHVAAVLAARLREESWRQVSSPCSCGDPTRRHVNHRKTIPCYTYSGSMRYDVGTDGVLTESGME